jgi:hypothetical protein
VCECFVPTRLKMIRKKPAWWMLFLIVPLMLAALIGVTRVGLAPMIEQIVQIVIVIAAFWAIYAWVRRNEAEIEWYEFDQAQRRMARQTRAARGDLPIRSHDLPQGAKRETLPPLTGFGSKRNRRAVFYVQQPETPDRDQAQRIVVDPEMIQNRNY